MENIKRNKKVIFICILLLLVVLFIYLFTLNKEQRDINSIEDRENYKYLEKYDSNEYVPVYVTEEDMVKKYLNDYKNNMLSDLNEAYNSLNKEYREKRFGSLDKYKEYINNFITLSTYSMEVDKYSVSSIGGDKVFNIYDKSGNQYIIREKSIMNYEVYLDEYTVIIK